MKLATTCYAMLIVVMHFGAAVAMAGSGDGWQPSFRAGMIDPSTGAAIRGTEVVHLVTHKGRLFAGNGYWMDTRGYDKTSWSQVLVLEAPDGSWKVDLALGAGHVRVTALQSVSFTTDADGKPLAAPVNLLLAASDRRRALSPNPLARPEFDSSVWTRNDETGTWVKTTLPVGHQLRRSTRALAVHRDRRTGVDRVFIAVGAPGILSGVFDAELPGKVRWDEQAELGPVSMRPMSFVEAGGTLYVSAGVAVYRRLDGEAPSWKKIYSDGTREHWELGGIRGLTAIPSPEGRGESILFSHTDRIVRIDPATDHRATVELRIRPLLARSWGVEVPGAIIAAYSDMMPLVDPETGRTVHLIGVEGRIQRGGPDAEFRENTYGGWYAGGTYLIREPDGDYRVGEVNGRWSPGKPKLVAPRSYVVSPFAEDGGRYIYFGGFDCNFFPALDTAWIFRAPVETVLDRAAIRLLPSTRRQSDLP